MVWVGLDLWVMWSVVPPFLIVVSSQVVTIGYEIISLPVLAYLHYRVGVRDVYPYVKILYISFIHSIMFYNSDYRIVFTQKLIDQVQYVA